MTIKNLKIDHLKIGTRASPLALRQTEIFCNFLTQHFADIAYEIIPITTDGDKILDKPLYEIGGKGLFIKELDQALIRGEIDIAIHSAKDLESELHDNIKLACILPRDDRRDCLIGRQQNFSDLQQLPANATIGTCSPRRKAQLLTIRPDLEIIPLRGRIETRLEKMHDLKLDAIMLAMAGLARMNIAQGTPIPADIMLPSAGQGIIVATCHAENQHLHQALYPLCHPLTLDELSAERALLRRLGGSCHTPVGVYSQFIKRSPNDEKRAMPPSNQLTAQLSATDGSEHFIISKKASDSVFKTPTEMGDTLGKILKAQAPHLLPSS